MTVHTKQELDFVPDLTDMNLRIKHDVSLAYKGLTDEEIKKHADGVGESYKEMIIKILNIDNGLITK